MALSVTCKIQKQSQMFFFRTPSRDLASPEVMCRRRQLNSNQKQQYCMVKQENINGVHYCKWSKITFEVQKKTGMASDLPKYPAPEMPKRLLQKMCPLLLSRRQGSWSNRLKITKNIQLRWAAHDNLHQPLGFIAPRDDGDNHYSETCTSYLHPSSSQVTITSIE